MTELIFNCFGKTAWSTPSGLESSQLISREWAAVSARVLLQACFPDPRVTRSSYWEPRSEEAPGRNVFHAPALKQSPPQKAESQNQKSYGAARREIQRQRPIRDLPGVRWPSPTDSGQELQGVGTFGGGVKRTRHLGLQLLRGLWAAPWLLREPQLE